MNPDITQSDAYRLGYCISMFEAIIGHLGAAAAQRSPSDDKIVADHIDVALARAKDGMRVATAAWRRSERDRLAAMTSQKCGEG